MKNTEPSLMTNAEYPSWIENRSKTIIYLMTATKFHKEADRQVEDGDYVQAAENTFLENCYLHLASEALKIETALKVEYNKGKWKLDSSNF